MKKTLVFLLSLGCCLLWTSCKKDIPGTVDKNGSFDAALPVPLISADDTALFTLSGNPDVIAFYSGEPGNNYDNRERTVLTGGRLKVKFDSRVNNKPADTLEVLLSRDFNGIFDSSNVAAANWKKLTGLFTFPLPSTPLGTFVSSGTPPGTFTDITDSVIAGQPFYFAFRYDINKNNNIEWSIAKLGMYNFFTDGTATSTVIDSMSNNSGGFAAVKMGETANRWTKTSTLYKFLNSSSSKLGASHWYISRALNPNAVSPDRPVVVKNISQSPLSVYKYRYRTPGTYKAVFVAAYSRLNYERAFVKEFTVTVQ